MVKYFYSSLEVGNMKVVVVDGLSGRMGQLFIEKVKAAKLPC